MPSGGINSRSHQVALLSSLMHQKKASPKFKKLLEKFVSLSSGTIKASGLSHADRAIVRELRKDYLKATKLPASFVKAFSQLATESSQVWATARKENNFKIFAPFLEKIVALSRKKAEILGFEDDPY